MNLSQSPTSNVVASTQANFGCGPRWRFLVFVSLLLAIAIEVFPTEADILWTIGFHTKNLLLVFLAKAVCLVIILLPLSVYIGLNGWRGLRVVMGRVYWIFGIILIKLFIDGIPFIH
jgi:hypothetical protein